jgi:hypothetical protein
VEKIDNYYYDNNQIKQKSQYSFFLEIKEEKKKLHAIDFMY